MALPPPLPARRVLRPPPLPSSRNLDQAQAAPEDNFRSNRTTGDLGDDIRGAPMGGEWVSVTSTWVLRSSFKRHPELPNGQPSMKGDWFVEFLDGSLVVYRMTGVDVWGDFFNSSSKGQFIYYRCKETHREYELLRGPSRKVTAKHRKIRDVVKHPERRKYAR